MRDTILKWGLIFAIAAIVMTILSRFVLGTDPAKMNTLTSIIVGVISVAVSVACLVMALREVKQNESGYLTYGRGVKVGFLTCLAAGFVVSVFTYFYNGYIDDSQIKTTQNMIREKNEEIFDKNPNMTEKEKEKIESYQMMMTSPGGMAISGFFGYAIFGIILSLIVSAFIKNNPPEGWIPGISDSLYKDQDNP
ncbi:MAG: DUF4199 domain-containing protein [Bacteroidetes bacterium]|nr:DUF4199 domain-containing protein [Bacteroidota bacterium]